jgi:hypothetical protein
LVFAELTKSKKGAEYIALFTFFSFQCKASPWVHPWHHSLTTNSLDSHYSLFRASPGHQRTHPLLRLPSETPDRPSELRVVSGRLL